MFGPFSLILALLTVQDPTPPTSEPQAQAQAPEAAPNPGEARALAEYEKLRQKTPATAAAQWKLALWCEKMGLKTESIIHLGRVIELAPTRESAWLKLGFKKHDGRWMTPRQIAEAEAFKKAEKSWLAELKKWHAEIHGGKKQAEAREALGAVTDEAAVSAVYREFGVGGPRDQEIAIQLFGQISSPVASKTLALLAIYGKSPAVRRVANETLRGRDPEEYLEVFVALMKDILKYEVRPVGGPGSPGVLFVEGERYNVKRFYAPPTPNIAILPGDSIGYDMNGMPVISRTRLLVQGAAAGVKGSKDLVEARDSYVTETFSYGQALAEARRGAVFAQSQLAGDVAVVESLNEERKQFNEIVMAAARTASGKNPGSTAKNWRDLIAKVDRYGTRPVQRTVPTIDELVPLGYVPNFASAISTQLSFATRRYVDT
ncbi:hypothetical protein P12x_004694 [Tundrisphaera lichenicola]|uniref:hypothetical protein n=1 Tax=Tundrisphaera lichenicola TaxID=2029860 RepID=UPI003EB73F64